MSKLVMDAAELENWSASQHVTVATFCLLIYDHVLTFSDEVNLVWQTRSVNLVKLLFIFNRYAVPAVIAVDTALVTRIVSIGPWWWIFEILMETLSLWSTTLIIALRVRALWVDRKDIRRILIWSWSVHVVTSFALTINVLAHSSFESDYFNVCMGSIEYWWTLWVPGMLFHLVIFGLMGAKAWFTPRDEKSPLLIILLIDGFIFFFFVFSLMLINTVIWALEVPSLVQLPHDSVWALCTIAITRLLLSLQKRYHAHHVSLSNDDDDEVDIEIRDGLPAPLSPIFWLRTPSRVDPPLDDPFYAYYAAPFPVTPTSGLGRTPTIQQNSNKSTNRTTATSSRTSKSAKSLPPGDGDSLPGWIPPVPPIPALTPFSNV
ncbi:uncharacterized protein EI90DRAFT_3087857 [Cantharellus anzutake]|uniref:uncharacterized protein n=1 Tax=Cantharellus anzutake TaxID=1750568 RepID=UPI001903ACB1|nr:uncharacterized protein EI90DRAFT_3087857 [Cantharellus anzutake]KAF8315755.1 hypothetical protein EI90DRAFT_3087857 [Cantharellus anzutake]